MIELPPLWLLAFGAATVVAVPLAVVEAAQPRLRAGRALAPVVLVMLTTTHAEPEGMSGEASTGVSKSERGAPHSGGFDSPAPLHSKTKRRDHGF